MMTSPTDAVRILLESIGEDVHRDGLLETPSRYVRALMEMTVGYAEDPAAHLAVQFEHEHDQMVALAGVEFSSLCEHHMLPFSGTFDVGYIPSGGRIVGLSKLVRCFNGYARRLQVQERLTKQVADAIESGLSPTGVAVVVRATHLCMVCRGVRQRGVMVTSEMRGQLRMSDSARAEFLRLTGGAS